MKSGTSKFIFGLILFALLVGWIYIGFNPSFTAENNMELNANYYPSITDENIKSGSTAVTDLSAAGAADEKDPSAVPAAEGGHPEDDDAGIVPADSAGGIMNR